MKLNFNPFTNKEIHWTVRLAMIAWIFLMVPVIVFLIIKNI